ncbi:SAM-dependent methyltransferase, partial [uncultured Abyssibacter sp.]|uniref:RlmE family RNA methyltransferase n=1 Tax=uncultured Abyssibacter sp. TaxID=2320202 RepID=UPI0032B10D4B
MGQKRRTASSRRWLREHESDQYVQRARAEGWRSRAVFKLDELNARDRFLRPGQRIVDLGAAPGGWTQYCVKTCGPGTVIIGIDLLPIAPLDGAVLIQDDFESDEGLRQLEAALNGNKIDLVLSDMAPNISGIASADQARATGLVELALDFCDRHLVEGGDFVSKAFQGEGFDPWLAEVKKRFQRVVVRKPAASRARSRE